MNQEQARTLIAALADGFDPDTGDALPVDSVCQRPAVIRALYLAAQALAAGGAMAAAPARELPRQAGKPWSQEEDEALAAAFKAGSSAGELAEAHCRTRGAIAARLVRLGLIEERKDLR